MVEMGWVGLKRFMKDILGWLFIVCTFVFVPVVFNYINLGASISDSCDKEWDLKKAQCDCFGQYVSDQVNFIDLLLMVWEGGSGWAISESTVEFFDEAKKHCLL